MEWSFKSLNQIRGANVKDVPSEKFIAAVADYLKKSGKFKIPDWIDVIKSGPNRYLAPNDPAEWIFIRAASLLRKLYITSKGLGVGAFTAHYGGKYERGCQHNITRKSSGKVIRYCLQQLESMKLVEVMKVSYGESKANTTDGRRMTKKGHQEMDNLSKELMKKSA
jgi:small subunit ribosomal protein S19e